MPRTDHQTAICDHRAPRPDIPDAPPPRPAPAPSGRRSIVSNRSRRGRAARSLARVHRRASASTETCRDGPAYRRALRCIGGAAPLGSEDGRGHCRVVPPSYQGLVSISAIGLAMRAVSGKKNACQIQPDHSGRLRPMPRGSALRVISLRVPAVIALVTPCRLVSGIACKRRTPCRSKKHGFAPVRGSALRHFLLSHATGGRQGVCACRLDNPCYALFFLVGKVSPAH